MDLKLREREDSVLIRLARFPLFSTDDLEEYCQHYARLLDRRIDMIAGSVRFAASGHTAHLELLTINSAQITGGLSVYTCNRAYGLMRMETGEASRRFGGRHGHHVAPGDGSLVSPGVEAKTVLQPPDETGTAAALTISLPEAMVKQEAEHLIGDGVIGRLEIKGPLDLRSDTFIGQIIDFILDQLECGDGGVFRKYPRIGQQFQRDLIAALIERTHNNYTPLVAHHFGGHAYRQVTLAEEYIAGHLFDPLTVADLAHAAHVSVRTLRDACHRQRSTTPELLLRNMKLHAARKRLEHPLPSDSVASVAHEFLFTNVGRFARHYREEFHGESPAETLRLGRRKLVISLGDALEPPDG